MTKKERLIIAAQRAGFELTNRWTTEQGGKIYIGHIYNDRRDGGRVRAKFSGALSGLKRGTDIGLLRIEVAVAFGVGVDMVHGWKSSRGGVGRKDDEGGNDLVVTHNYPLPHMDDLDKALIKARHVLVRWKLARDAAMAAHER